MTAGCGLHRLGTSGPGVKPDIGREVGQEGQATPQHSVRAPGEGLRRRSLTPKSRQPSVVRHSPPKEREENFELNLLSSPRTPSEVTELFYD